MERLIREIELQSTLFDGDRVVEQLHWGGGTPTFLSQAQMGRLMRATAARFDLRTDDLGEYSIEVDPRTVNPWTITFLRQLGFNRISLGVQDFDPVVQQAVNRLQSVEETLLILQTARAHRFRSINIDLMYGLPAQTAATFERTLVEVISAQPDRVALYNYAHLPGRFKPQRRIDTEALPSASEKLEILGMAIERLTAAGYIYIGMDHFARVDDELAIAQQNGQVQRNFQGYSTHADCDLVAMGVSAIGQVGHSYSQNTHDLQAYYEALDNGRLAVVRGLSLCLDDRLRRAIINRLMCDFELEFYAIEDRWHIVLREYFEAEWHDLEHMQADGLLELSPERLTILPAGRLLVRHVAMVFDRYLRADRDRSGYSRII